MTEPATLVQLIRQVRAQRQATDALEGERLRLEGSLIEFVSTRGASFSPQKNVALFCK